MRNPFRRISLRAALIVPISVLFLLLGLIELWLVRLHSDRQLAEALTLRAEILSREVSPRLRQYLETAPELMRGPPLVFAHRPELLRDRAFCRNLFREKMLPFPFVRGVYVGLPDGAYVGVRRDPAGGFRYVCAEAGDSPVRVEFRLGPAGEPGEQVASRPYDGRKRPWYDLARTRNAPVRTDVYDFAADGEPGITAATPLRGAGGELLGVMGVDIELASLNDFLREVRPTPGAQLYVFDPRELPPGVSPVIASTCFAGHAGDGPREAARPTCDALMRSAFESLRRRMPGPGGPESPVIFALKLDGIAYRLSAVAHADRSGLGYVVASLIPEEDLTGGLHRYDRERVVLFVTVVAVAILIAWLRGLMLSRVIGGVSEAAKRISEAGPSGARGARLPDSRIGEIADLSASFNRMEARLEEAFEMLERRVAERTAELTSANEELTRTAKELGLARFVLDRSPIAVFLMNETGAFLYVNESAAIQRGYTREELLRLDVTTIDPDCPPETWAREWAGLRKLSPGQSHVLRTRHRRRDGSVFPVEVLAHVLDLEGRRCVVALVADITEREAAEHRLRLALTQADQALELTRSGYWRVPAGDSGLYIGSERTCSLFGLRPMPGWRYRIEDRLDSIEAADPVVGAEVRERFRLARNGAIPVFDVTYPYRRHDDGRVIWLHDLGVVFHDTPEHEGEMFGVVQDVTDIVEAKREVEAARNAAESANRLKTEFLANMSHEIRTPMNAILGYAQLLRRDTALPPVCHAQVETINRAGEHLLAIINDILEMSKIEAGRIVVKQAGFDLHALLDGLLELYGERAKAKGLTLALRRDASLPRLVSTDEGKLRQALLNLVGNAVKFTSRGGVSVEASAGEAPRVELSANVEPLVTGEVMLVFAVRDTGPGIAPEELGRLFRPFVQSAAGHSAGGTGLGLAISRQYAKLLGGDITVESEPGRGSTFTLSVLARCVTPAEVRSHTALPRVLRLAPGRPPVRVLVADDLPQNRDLLASLLAPLGFDLRFAGDGAEVLQVCESWKPHAILMDVRMPVMDGYEACRRVKAMPGGASVYVMALTASAFEENKAAVLACGADDFMRKPFDQDELLAVLGERLHLDYLYADEVDVAPGARPAGAGDSGETVPVVPAELAGEFAEACRAADYERLLELCDRLEPSDPPGSRMLRAMVCAFNYEGLARLFPSGR